MEKYETKQHRAEEDEFSGMKPMNEEQYDNMRPPKEETNPQVLTEARREFFGDKE